MTKKKLSGLILFLSFFILISIGCDFMDNQWKNITNSGSGSSSSSSSSSGSGSGPKVTPQDVPSHGQVTVNLLQRTPFKGQNLDPTFWSNMEAYCKAGPTQLIIADMNFLPTVMRQAGFPGSDNQLYYATASTYAGLNWSPGDDPESQYLSDNRQQIDAMWSRYIQAVVQVMQKAPRTTAIIIINDGPDRCGSRLASPTYQNMGSVRDRVQMGDVYYP